VVVDVVLVGVVSSSVLPAVSCQTSAGYRMSMSAAGAARHDNLFLGARQAPSCSSKRQLPPKRPLRSCPVRPTRSASPCYPRSSLTGPPIARGVNFALAAPQRTRRGGPAVGRSSRRAVASPLRTPRLTSAMPPRKHASRTHREQGFEQGLGAPTRKVLTSVSPKATKATKKVDHARRFCSKSD
jgi:hypothetical protein